jgi:TolB protein
MEEKLMQLVRYLFFYWLFFLCGCSHNDVTFLRGDRYESGGVFVGTSPSLSPDNQMIIFGTPRYGEGDICRINFDGSNWTRLTFSDYYEGEPSFSPDGEKIVYVSEKYGVGEICVMDIDGKNEMRLTENSYYDSSPSFSPDGSKIVFVRNEIDSNCGLRDPQIFLMNSDGTNETKIHYNDAWGADPSFSFNGNMLAYTTGDNENRYIKILEIPSLRIIAEIKRPGHCDEPSFSPDGGSVVFVADWDSAQWEFEIYSMTFKDNSIKRITDMKGIDKQNPRYLKNGKDIIFFSLTDEKGGYIYIVNENGDGKILTKTY